MAMLSTKLRIPTPRRQLVPRPRLTEQLRSEAAAPPRLVLVSAPAGFGKTTLLSEWLTEKEQVAWLSLDETDNDLRRFLTQLVASLQAAGAEAGSDALALLETPRTTPTEAVMTSLVNDLDRLPGQTMVALDDYHVIETLQIHEAVSFLVEHLPATASLTIASRSDPPLGLARLRSRGELLELRVADLRFTVEEAESFLNRVMGLQLSSVQVSTLDTRTEGWAAGLQLAALSLRGHDDVDLVRGGVRRQSPLRPGLLGRGGAATPARGRAPLHVPDRRARADERVVVRRAHRLGRRTARRSRPWSATTCSWSRSTTSGAGTATTTSSPTLCGLGWPPSSPTAWPASTPPPAGGTPTTGSSTTRVAHAIAAGDAERAADLIELALPEVRRQRQDRTLRGWLKPFPTT